mgnify:CR=1 FL=1
MAYLSDADVLIGLNKEIDIAKANASESIYSKFSADLEKMRNGYASALKKARSAEIIWHKEVDETGEIKKKAIQAYIKWREMILADLPGADLIDWEQTDATPDEIELTLESMIVMVEENTDKVKYSEEAITELTAVSDELDRDRKSVV